MNAKRGQRKPTNAERKAQSARDRARNPREQKSYQRPSRGRRRQQQPRSRGGFNAPRLGRAIGGFFGPTGASIGASAGEMFKRLTGFGDYKVNSNSLATTVDALPSFGNVSRGTKIVHREFLFDVVTAPIAGAFNIQRVPLQPGLLISFPWLSATAENYQQYQLNGVVYEFKSNSYDALASTNTASGTVVMSTNYNVLEPDFTNKFTMEQTQYTCSGKPSRDLLHPIECARAETPASILYTRAGPVTLGDARLYDWGNFYIATVGMQGVSTNIGELWVTYDITLLKPKLTNTVDVYDHWVISPTNVLPGGAAYYGVVSHPPILSVDSDLGSSISSFALDSNLDTVVFPPGYTGNVQLLYNVVPTTTTVASATLETSYGRILTGGVTVINAFSSTAASNQGAGRLLYNGVTGTTYVLWLKVVNGGAITLLGGTNNITPFLSADLFLIALPPNFFSSSLPIVPGPLISLPDSKTDLPRTSTLHHLDEDGDVVMSEPDEPWPLESKVSLRDQPALLKSLFPGVRKPVRDPPPGLAALIGLPPRKIG